MDSFYNIKDEDHRYDLLLIFPGLYETAYGESLDDSAMDDLISDLGKMPLDEFNKYMNDLHNKYLETHPNKRKSSLEQIATRVAGVIIPDNYGQLLIEDISEELMSEFGIDPNISIDFRTYEFKFDDGTSIKLEQPKGESRVKYTFIIDREPIEWHYVKSAEDVLGTFKSSLDTL